MFDKKIAWERWDEDVIEQEIVENFYEKHADAEDEEGVEDALMFLEKIPSLVTTPMGMFQLHDKIIPGQLSRKQSGLHPLEVCHP